MCGQTCGNLCPMQPKRKQSKDGLSRNQSSTMPDNWEEYSLLNQTMKQRAVGKTTAKLGNARLKYACIVDADESTRPRPEGAGHKPHQDHITAKGMNSMTHCSLVHKFIPMPQAFKKFQMQRQQWKKNGKNWRESRMAADQRSETRKKWSMKQEIRADTFILRHWWICVISRIRSWNLSIKSTTAGSYSGNVVKDDSGSYAVLTEQESSASNDSRKSHGHCIKASRMFRTSSWCSIRWYSGQNGRCIHVIQNSKVRMSRYLDTSTEAQMAQIMVQYGRPSRSSRKESVRSSSGRTITGKAIWESSIGTRLGKSFYLGLFFVSREKGLFLSVYVDDIKLAGKTENIEPSWTILMKDVDLGEPTSFLDHVCLGCTQRECKISNGYCGNRIQDFCWSQGKLPTRASGKPDAETQRKVSSKEMCGHILRTCTKSQRHARMTIISKKKMSQ